MRQSTPQHWERYWAEREEIDDVYSNEDRIKRQLDALAVEDRWVMEVGAGSGRDSLELAHRGAHVVVLDYTRSSFTVIRKQADRLGVTVHPVCADARAMPFREGTFGLVFHQGLMEHFRDPMPLLDENVRVLGSGGHLLVDVPQRFHVYTLAKHVMILLGRWFAGWETEYSPSELESLVRRARLQVVRTYGEWMVPGFFYRSLRYGLMRARLATLPKYPPEIWPFGPLGRKTRAWMRQRRLGLYTCAMIGTLGRK
ncbi:MAG: class I SAM-dependent methyltransferase [Candidatus Eisenbacteria bacterium]|uniref:Class I SAM-dependent methyltransferase n=1 Tax=Eiseniibacteriota bacterium TaxID=2212470 RepID=A0A956LY22_UNCEI|nr:class I SAM-dependent methyltransferase [Candidatus Eisenbacteria bacterium]